MNATKTPNPVDVHIGGAIRRIRQARGITQEGLAAACGITFQQIQKYEKGTNRVSGSRLTQIAGVLGVKASDFFPDAKDSAVTPLMTLSPVALEVARSVDDLPEPVRGTALRVVRALNPA